MGQDAKVAPPPAFHFLVIHMKILFFILVYLFAGLPFAASAQTEPVAIKKPCAFEPLLDWQAAQVRWVGACVRGQAHGYGVLRHLVNGKVDSAFYGRLDKGVPKVGAIDFGGSYQAGDFSKGQLIERDADFEGRFRGLEEAAKGAKAAAAQYEKEGNKASAKYYRSQAENWLKNIRE